MAKLLISACLALLAVAVLVLKPDLAGFSRQHEEASREVVVEALEHDPNGYLLFCLCMGRFGNQMEHLLGSLEFAKRLNRTLVLPPFLGYEDFRTLSLTPYTALFNITELQQYHRVISMTAFLQHIAPTHWPTDQRVISCTHPRHDGRCMQASDRPHGMFWSLLGIHFAAHRPLSGVSWTSSGEKWREVVKDPVLVLPGAPATFPMQAEDRHIQNHVVWLSNVTTIATSLIHKHTKGPFLAVHIRNGSDWIQACDIAAKPMSVLMASPQCKTPGQMVTKPLCLPSLEVILSQTRQVIEKHQLHDVFVGSDDTHAAKALEIALNKDEHERKIKVFSWKEGPIMDLRVFSLADHFIDSCNCFQSC